MTLLQLLEESRKPKTQEEIEFETNLLNEVFSVASIIKQLEQERKDKGGKKVG